MNARAAGVIVLAAFASACATIAAPQAQAVPSPIYKDLISRAEVWQPTHVGTANLRVGPSASDGFDPSSLVRCTYKAQEMEGKTPKFTCVLPNGDALKVKYGRQNGEVFAEVAATRLLWALGFGADRMYPVRVECEGCPAALAQADVGATATPGGTVRFDYAAIERKMAGREIESTRGSGWSWQDLELVEPVDPMGRTHRDALKLLAVMLQHTDSKREQQRLVCLDDSPSREEEPPGRCARPFLMINDLGRTFGKANAFNADRPGSVNLRAWAESPVWLGDRGCVGNLLVSVTGTLDDPSISEAGRRFLAGLLTQLTSEQLRDMFTLARFSDRASDAQSGADVEAWVRTFQDKVAEITTRTCPDSRVGA